MKRKLLNIGCGTTVHPQWINIDLHAQCDDVIEHDLRTGLPFEDGTIDGCYSSHVLEHLRPDEAGQFLDEQKRVLRPGGIIRVVVPDLEAAVRNYIGFLDELVAGDTSNEANYDWTLIELYDQTTRDRSGGEMGRLLLSGTMPNDAFVIGRCGGFAEEAINAARRRNQGLPPAPASEPDQRAGGRRRSLSLREFSRWRQRAAERLVRLVAGPAALASFREGTFRNSGEIHRVMYDRFSLGRLLHRHGFVDVSRCGPDESRIEGFAAYELDTFEGRVRKPDSLFIEAVLP